ncbi:hypothetical protein Lalb_Chr22g0357611 [Lupinus albus]|uniref:Uncharacterized protein n=1 Tax=Lupinus albus TaxID=3870 RepID=A0A6A4NGR4_LUPAL|nr:hypothetical protein Lalb_Chr22g0357611 [Lupinus albus]
MWLYWNDYIDLFRNFLMLLFYLNPPCFYCVNLMSDSLYVFLVCSTRDNRVACRAKE